MDETPIHLNMPTIVTVKTTGLDQGKLILESKEMKTKE